MIRRHHPAGDVGGQAGKSTQQQQKQKQPAGQRGHVPGPGSPTPTPPKMPHRAVTDHCHWAPPSIILLDHLLSAVVPRYAPTARNILDTDRHSS
mmetsp:Transcript_11053/g.31719  ORF Transcript_11053/g.31719 Transcript_11053/m.31719 type:complete len:94 (+) Transcript_11053:772-1053(+)